MLIRKICKVFYATSIRQHARLFSTIRSVPNEDKLKDFLYTKIKYHGPISVSEFMVEALTNPKYGYYVTKDPLGKDGDFITSPEISQLFGEILAFWTVNFWQNEKGTEKFQIVELGPGRGTMMSDMIRIFSQLKNKSLNGIDIRFNMVEVSPSLSKIQFDNLCINEVDTNITDSYKSGKTKDGFQVDWFDSIQKVPNDCFTFVFAHEFFDALPIHKFEKTDKGYREIFIDIDPASSCKKFRFVLHPNPTLASTTLIMKHENRQHFEVCAKAGMYIKSISDLINKHGGVGLIIDYGHFGTAGDTLRAFKAHHQEDVLEQVGKCDVTADVDFSYLCKLIKENNARSYGPISQRIFLSNMGIDFLHQRLVKQCRTKEQFNQVKSSYEWMMDQKKMGSRFNFLAMVPYSHQFSTKPRGLLGFPTLKRRH